MPGPKPAKISLTDQERQELQGLLRAHKTSQQIAFRARIILLLADGLHTSAVAEKLATTRITVRLWRHYWIERGDCLVVERLQDQQRPGTPPTFSPEQWCQIVALACEPPARSQRPISHWTPRELADEAKKRGIVASISARHVGRFLKSGRFKTTSEPVLAQW